MVGGQEADVEARARVDGQARLPQHRHGRHAHGRAHVHLAAHQRLDQRRLAVEAAEGQLAQARRAAPVPVEGRQLDQAGARRGHAERAGADRRVGLAPERARAEHAEQRLRERGQERGVGLLEGQGHGLRPQARARAAQGLDARQVGQVGQHRVGVEGGAVVEAHARAQREGPGAVVEGGPGGGQHRLAPAPLGPQAHQRLAHVGQHLLGDEVRGPVGVERHGVGQLADHQPALVAGRGRGGQQQGQQQAGRAHAPHPESSWPTSRPA